MNCKYKKVFSLILLFFFLLAERSLALEVSDIPGMINWNCIDFRVIGVCVKPPLYYVGIVIMYWEPALLIETVKKPGDTVIGSLVPVVSSLTQETISSSLSAITGLVVPVSGGSTSSKITGANLQFNEAHVYEFPFRNEIMSFIDMECPDKLPTGSFIKYLSELDSLEWRIGLIEAMHPKSIASAASGLTCAATGAFLDDLCMGFWGATYPRRGFLTHQSEVVASAAAAVRAVSISGLLGSQAHVVLESIGFLPSFKSDKLELIYPNPSGCIKIGQNPLTWESGKLSSSGKYLWVYWRRRICCVY
ncbi:MAG: TraU family protein [Candidatus Omnitrophica bacterium]|nr:TraU family protein [Candidatus Omnitrophota bacterium]